MHQRLLTLQGGLGAGDSSREACPGGVLKVPGSLVGTMYTQSNSGFMEPPCFGKLADFSCVICGYVVGWPHVAQVRFWRSKRPHFEKRIGSPLALWFSTTTPALVPPLFTCPKRGHPKVRELSQNNGEAPSWAMRGPPVHGRSTLGRSTYVWLHRDLGVLALCMVPTVMQGCPNEP